MLSSWSGPIETLNQFIGTLPLLVWRARRDGDWLWASPQWQEFTGQTFTEYLGEGWLDAVHPDDRDGARGAWWIAPDKQSFEAEFRILKADEQRYCWHKTRAAPVCDGSGKILEWLGTSTDIDALKRLREQESALLAELQHRVRNMLGVVRALGRRTADNCQTINEFVLKFDGRLNAFARTQSLSTRSPTGKVNLREIVFDELLLHQLHNDSRITAEGPDVMLGAKAANLLGLALHELASHAGTRHSQDDVSLRMSIQWALEHDAAEPMLRIVWMETGRVSDDADQPFDGLGQDILGSALQYELDAQSTIDIRPGGLEFVVCLPLARAEESHC